MRLVMAFDLLLAGISLAFCIMALSPKEYVTACFAFGLFVYAFRCYLSPSL